MKTLLVHVLFVCSCFGVIGVLSFIGSTPLHPAEAQINYTNLNYTHFLNDPYFGKIITDSKGAKLPNRNLDFGISISQTCYTIMKHSPINSTSSCPSYEAIMAVFPDTSNQDVSGAFIFKDGFIQRGRPQMESHYNYYDFMIDTTIIFIDPDSRTKDQLSMITIESSLPEFPINFKVHDNIREMGVGRYIDNCRHATIDGKNWIFLLGDTMEYLRHGCDPKFTQFNDIKIIRPEYTDHDITTSSLWLHQQFLEWVKENCLYEYDKC